MPKSIGEVVGMVVRRVEGTADEADFLRCLIFLLGATTAETDAWAWGATGHEWVSGIAIEKLPDSVPE